MSKTRSFFIIGCSSFCLLFLSCVCFLFHSLLTFAFIYFYFSIIHSSPISVNHTGDEIKEELKELQGRISYDKIGNTFSQDQGIPGIAAAYLLERFDNRQ